MIEKLNGTTETVDFKVSSTTRLYHNHTAEDFPLHWHVPGEIICPIENTYQVTIAGQALTLLPHDVLIIASGELHSITAPPSGERYIVNFSNSFYEQFQELSLFFSTLHPYKLFRRADDPDLADRLFAQLTRMEAEYGGADTYRDCEIASMMLHYFATIGRHYTRQIHGEELNTPKQQEREPFAGRAGQRSRVQQISLCPPVQDDDRHDLPQLSAGAAHPVRQEPAGGFHPAHHRSGDAVGVQLSGHIQPDLQIADRLYAQRVPQARLKQQPLLKPKPGVPARGRFFIG